MSEKAAWDYKVDAYKQIRSFIRPRAEHPRQCVRVKVKRGRK